ncbi:phage baseplate assembly protein domain-containing protein [Gluconacetobacter diazotrophicus]|uniref:phage baseplate assembly protein domain-containing protein n=1 Tax=Gluconacetobacter diazotrophicus TaxID=33996 RepID=UPI000173B3C3|nr:phage baseplate assembly protein [Gluconacetobacter diazotrophicus]
MISDIITLKENSIKHEQARIHMVKKESLSMDTQTDTSVSYSQIRGVGNGTYNYVPIVSNYGFTSVPLSGADAITLNPYGRDDNKLVIGTHDARYHPIGLSAGETQIYDDAKQSVYLTSGNDINITSNQSLNIIVNGNKVVSVRGGSVYVNGNLIPSNGWSGSFSTPLGQTVRVDSGIITDVS